MCREGDASKQSDAHSAALTALESKFPQTTDAERRRFLAARHWRLDHATSMLKDHLDWRAATLPLAPDAPRLGAQVPEWVLFLHENEATARDGSRLLLVQAARCRPEACSPSQHAAAIAAVLDSELPRESTTKISILIDVDGVQGARNASAKAQMPVLRELNRVLGHNFPERVNKLFIYPVPWALKSIWVMVRAFLDPNTANKAKLFIVDTRKGRVPPELDEYVDLTLLHASERAKEMMIDAPRR